MRVPSEIFSLSVEHSDSSVRLLLTGRFDAAAIPALDDVIGEVERRDVLMDLDGITFMDGAAWLAVMNLEHRVHDWGKGLQLVNTPGSIRRIFEITATEHLLSGAVGS